jgi:methyl-accepting chemotaxis protein
MALITRANREHSTVAAGILDIMKDIRKITDRNAEGVKETRRFASSMLDQSRRITEIVEKEGK